MILLYQPGPRGQPAEPVVGKTRLMKLLFLLSEEAKIDEFLTEKQNFIPFRYGPFDADVYDDLEALKELGLVQESPSSEQEDQEPDAEPVEAYDAGTEYRLTPLGMAKARELAQSAPKDVIKRVTNVKTIFGNMPLVELLHFVYTKYAKYADVSDLRGKF
jgi:hypothetical protein